MKLHLDVIFDKTEMRFTEYDLTEWKFLMNQYISTSHVVRRLRRRQLLTDTHSPITQLVSGHHWVPLTKASSYAVSANKFHRARVSSDN